MTEIGPLRVEDASRCAELERLLFAEDDPWTAGAFVDAIVTGDPYLAARCGGRLVGYAGLRVSGPEAEVHTIAVDPAHQGRGTGRALLQALLACAPGAAVFLEVRTDNEAAQALYRSEGFTVVGIRRRYYRPSGADAYTMRRAAT
ncbi:MAG: ribosomal protein S18-alanine N-acetyltransferase [Pseudonocardiaceae bacterium]